MRRGTTQNHFLRDFFDMGMEGGGIALAKAIAFLSVMTSTPLLLGKLGPDR